MISLIKEKIPYNDFQIGEICDLIKGKTPTMKAIPGKFPLVVTAENRKSCNEYQIDNDAICIPLVSSTGHGHASINRIHFQSGKFALANIMVAVIPKDKERVFAKYLYYLFENNKEEYFVSLMSGTANVSLKIPEIKNVVISLPPIDVQKSIVSKIEIFLSLIDSLNELLKISMIQFDEYRKSLLDFIYSNFDTNLLSSIADINPHKPKTGTISDELEVSFIPMKCVAKLTGDVELSYTKKYSEVKNGFTYFENGDIIFAKITPCMENGKIAIVQNLKNNIGFGSTEFHVIRFKDEISKKFYFWYLTNETFRINAQKHMRGTAGQQRVPVQYLQESLVPIASISEQNQVVLEIEKNISIIQKNKEITDKTIQMLNELKISLFTQTFDKM